MAQLEMEYALSPHAEQSLVKMGLDGDIRSAAWRKQRGWMAPQTPHNIPAARPVEAASPVPTATLRSMERQ